MISNYQELQDAVATWIDRTDLTTTIPDFISLAEARFIRKIRHWKMEKSDTLTTVGGTAAVDLPADYLEMRSLTLDVQPSRSLELLPPAINYNGQSSTGLPSGYTIQDGKIRLHPVPDGAYDLIVGYYAFIPLSAVNDENWLLTDYPDVYLYGSLLQAEGFVMNDKRLGVWKGALDEALGELRKDASSARWNGSPLIIRGQH